MPPIFSFLLLALSLLFHFSLSFLFTFPRFLLPSFLLHSISRVCSFLSFRLSSLLSLVSPSRTPFTLNFRLSSLLSFSFPSILQLVFYSSFFFYARANFPFFLFSLIFSFSSCSPLSLYHPRLSVSLVFVPFLTVTLSYLPLSCTLFP